MFLQKQRTRLVPKALLDPLAPLGLELMRMGVIGYIRTSI